MGLPAAMASNIFEGSTALNVSAGFSVTSAMSLAARMSAMLVRGSWPVNSTFDWRASRARAFSAASSAPSPIDEELHVGQRGLEQARCLKHGAQPVCHADGSCVGDRNLAGREAQPEASGVARSCCPERGRDTVGHVAQLSAVDASPLEVGDEALRDTHHRAGARVEAKLEPFEQARYPPDPDAPTGVPAILRGGPAELYSDIPAELIERAARDEEHLELIRQLGMRSGVTVPMRIGGETLGVITLVSAESGRRFDEDDLAFIEDLALRAATAVENARLYAAQERVAHTLQASLLPERLPELSGWEIGAAYQAGERDADVGGDFYDILAVEGGHLIVLGDVTGKGVEAAALTSLVRYSGRMAARFDPRPARVLSLINEVLREQSRLSLVTAVCALVSSEGDRASVTVASAGHPLPLLAPAGRGARQPRRPRCAARRRGRGRLDGDRGGGRPRRHPALLHRRRHRDAR